MPGIARESRILRGRKIHLNEVMINDKLIALNKNNEIQLLYNQTSITIIFLKNYFISKIFVIFNLSYCDALLTRGE